MPDDEHRAVLRRGVAAWNAWRVEHHEAPDLSRAGLSGLDLSGFDLSRADLQGAGLRGTNCSDLAGAPRRREFVQGADFAPGPSFTARIPDFASREPRYKAQGTPLSRARWRLIQRSFLIHRKT
jgi:uncharacterized protein YjbI with pentapeptide repeats